MRSLYYFCDEFLFSLPPPQSILFDDPLRILQARNHLPLLMFGITNNHGGEPSDFSILMFVVPNLITVRNSLHIRVLDINEQLIKN
jgi:hypothetical protein